MTSRVLLLTTSVALAVASIYTPADGGAAQHTSQDVAPKGTLDTAVSQHCHLEITGKDSADPAEHQSATGLLLAHSWPMRIDYLHRNPDGTESVSHSHTVQPHCWHGFHWSKGQRLNIVELPLPAA